MRQDEELALHFEFRPYDTSEAVRQSFSENLIKMEIDTSNLSDWVRDFVQLGDFKSDESGSNALDFYS